MNVLIVGGTGLISTAITRQLLARGDAVTLFNRGRTEARFAGEVRRLLGDRRDYGAFEASMQGAGGGGGFDCVIDMICMTPADAESAVRAFRGRTRHYIFCSTVDVYAMPAARYPTDEGEPQRPTGRYGADKSACEASLMAAHRRGDFPVTIIRPAQSYGEGGTPQHTFGQRGAVLHRLRQGQPVIVHGDGSGMRVAAHVENIGGAFLGAAGNERAFGRAYNVTGDEYLTWDRYTECLAEALGGPPPALVHLPADLLARMAPEWTRPLMENYRFPKVFVNSAAKADLGYRYAIPFREGIGRTVAWLDAHGGITPGEGEDTPFYDRMIAAWERASSGIIADLRTPGAERSR